MRTNPLFVEDTRGRQKNRLVVDSYPTRLPLLPVSQRPIFSLANRPTATKLRLRTIARWLERLGLADAVVRSLATRVGLVKLRRVAMSTRIIASSAESVDEFWLRQVAKLDR